MSGNIYVARYKPVRRELQRLISDESLEILEENFLVHLDEIPDHFIVLSLEDLEIRLAELGAEWTEGMEEVVRLARGLSKHYAEKEIVLV